MPPQESGCPFGRGPWNWRSQGPDNCEEQHAPRHWGPWSGPRRGHHGRCGPHDHSGPPHCGPHHHCGPPHHFGPPRHEHHGPPHHHHGPPHHHHGPPHHGCGGPHFGPPCDRFNHCGPHHGPDFGRPRGWWSKDGSDGEDRGGSITIPFSLIKAFMTRHQDKNDSGRSD